MGLDNNNLTFGNVSALDYDIYIKGKDIYNAPARSIKQVDIPGRNGALTIDYGNYSNVTINYDAYAYGTSQDELRAKITAFKNALVSQVGYQRLADTYTPYDYRLALYVDTLEVNQVCMDLAVKFTLSFNCKPQRYLVSGEDEVTVSDGDTINNPTLYDAEPLLMVEGYGNIGFNGYEIGIENETLGRVTVWSAGTYSTSRSINGMTRTLTYNETIDIAQFNNGDTFSYKMDGFANVNTAGLDVVVTPTSSSHSNANATHSIKKNSNYSYTLTDSLTMSHVIGTASTVTDTWTVSLPQAGEYFTLRITSDYDGEGTVTMTLRTPDYSEDEELYFSNIVIGFGTCTGTSTLSILGHPTYIDCELGEAYKYVNGSLVGLNSYIDLGSDLPKLSSGNNTFTIDNTITSLILVPRWWEL